MAKSDNQRLEEMHKNYTPTLCFCGKADDVHHPGKCGQHAEEELSNLLDQGVGGLGKRGPGPIMLDDSDPKVLKE